MTVSPMKGIAAGVKPANLPMALRFPAALGAISTHKSGAHLRRGAECSVLLCQRRGGADMTNDNDRRDFGAALLMLSAGQRARDSKR
jgi:hypothetical protein